MEDLGDAASDGIDQRAGFGEATCLIGEFAEDKLSVVGFAEEFTVQPALQTMAEGVVGGEELDEASGDEDEDRDGDGQVFLVPHQRKDEANDDECDDGEFGDEQGGAGEGVLGAHAEEQADVQRALHYDDVGEGKGRRKKEQEGRQTPAMDFSRARRRSAGVEQRRATASQSQ